MATSDLAGDIEVFYKLVMSNSERLSEGRTLSHPQMKDTFEALSRIEKKADVLMIRLNQMRCGTMNAIQKTILANPTRERLVTDLYTMNGAFGLEDRTRSYKMVLPDQKKKALNNKAPSSAPPPLMKELVEPEKEEDEVKEDSGEEEEEEEEEDGDDEEEEEDDEDDS